MSQTYGEYRKQMEAGMPEKIRVDFSQPITPEVLGREFSAAWKERYGQELVDWAETLDAHRHEFQQVADALSEVVTPVINRLEQSGVIDAVSRANAAVAEMAKEVAERQEMVRSLVTPLAHDYLPSQPTLSGHGMHPIDRESEMETLADRVAEKLYERMSASAAAVSRQAPPTHYQRSGTIQSLVLVESGKSDRYIIVINECYEKPLVVGRKQKAWDMLFRVAEGERIKYSTVKDQVDYLTVNRRCRLYTATQYPLCKILESVGDLVKAGVNLEIISDKAYKQRVAKVTRAKTTT